MTSVWLPDRGRFKPGASYQCGKVCENVDRLVIKTVPVFTEARSVANLIQLVDEIVERSSHTARLTELNMSDGMCLMKFRRKSRNFDPTTVEHCSSVDLCAEDTQV